MPLCATFLTLLCCWLYMFWCQHDPNQYLGPAPALLSLLWYNIL
jgi:hypothetical protein